MAKTEEILRFEQNPEIIWKPDEIPERRLLYPSNLSRNMVKTIEIWRFEKCPQEKLRNKKERDFITSELRSPSKNVCEWKIEMKMFQISHCALESWFLRPFLVDDIVFTGIFGNASQGKRNSYQIFWYTSNWSNKIMDKLLELEIFLNSVKT